MRKPKPTTRDYQDAAQLRVAVRRFLRRTEVVARAHRLTPQRYELLLAIKASDGKATVGSLSQTLRLGQTGVTQLARRAENLGLLRRKTSATDRRVRHLHLTPEGERRLAGAVAQLSDDRAMLAAALGELIGAGATQ